VQSHPLCEVNFRIINGGIPTKDLGNYPEELKSILSRPGLLAEAKACGFCSRERTIDVYAFFDILLYCANRESPVSLSFMATRLQERHGIEVSKTAVDKRFNDNCVKFTGLVLAKILRERYREYLCVYGDEIFLPFKRIRIKDSTRFQLPAAMREDFPGAGGSASGAGVTIQFEYDIKNGDILFMEISNGNTNDRQDAAKTCHQAEAGDLILRDLGYFIGDVFSVFTDHGTYFLSRMDSQTVVFNGKNGKRLSFRQLYSKMQSRGIEEQETDVLIGVKTQLKVRLLIRVVPEHVCEKRIREREKRNKSKSHKSCREYPEADPARKKQKFRVPDIKDETRARYHFTLLITNIEREDLPAGKAFPLYRLRWQVELMFKSRKSSLHVDKIQRMKKERFLSLLTAKLILAAICLQVFFRMQAALTKYDEKKEKKVRANKKQEKEKKLTYIILSREKVFRTLHAFFNCFIRMLPRRGGVAVPADKIQQLLRRNHELEIRKNRWSLSDILELFVCETEK
jgi:hypothetical protein